MDLRKEQLNTQIGPQFDIIVAGGGPAGCAAALAAARCGTKTLLVEQGTCLGGMWTAGLVNPIFDFQNKGGILREIITRLKKEYSFGGFIHSCFQIEDMKFLLEQMLCDAGVEILYGTIVSRAWMEGDTVKGVVVENKSGRTVFPAKVCIDCTGDADLAVSAGVKTVMGRQEDGKCQGMTLMFLLGNIDFMQRDCNELFDLIKEAAEQCASDFTLPYDRPYIIQIPNSNTAVVQLTHIRGLDPTDAFDLSRATIEGRKQAYETVRFMKSHIPQFRDVLLLQTASLIGVRESRRIVGEYTLTAEDALVGRQFEDGITCATFGMDIHNPEDTTQQCQAVKPYQIPYRCLVPAEIDGLLVAGRCISGTHEALASYRVTGNCAAMGEAAGYAAFECVKTGRPPRRITIHEIKSHME